MDANKVLGCLISCGVMLFVLIALACFAIFVVPGIIEGVFADILVGFEPIQ